MAYKVTELNIDEAYSKISEFDYALIYYLSDIVFDKTSNVKDIKRDECIEARFFNKDKEIHIWTDDDTKAVLIEDADLGNERIVKYVLASKYMKNGKNIVIKQYLEEDEDGQSNIVLTRLCGVE